jgi:hypothetical protein
MYKLHRNYEQMNWVLSWYRSVFRYSKILHLLLKDPQKATNVI